MNSFEHDDKETESFTDIMYRALITYETEKNVYLDKETMIEYINNNISKFETGFKNLCLECGEDMGLNNPRQLCGKYMCYNKE